MEQERRGFLGQPSHGMINHNLPSFIFIDNIRITRPRTALLHIVAMLCAWRATVKLRCLIQLEHLKRKTSLRGSIYHPSIRMALDSPTTTTKSGQNWWYGLGCPSAQVRAPTFFLLTLEYAVQRAF